MLLVRYMVIWCFYQRRTLSILTPSETKVKITVTINSFCVVCHMSIIFDQFVSLVYERTLNLMLLRPNFKVTYFKQLFNFWTIILVLYAAQNIFCRLMILLDEKNLIDFNVTETEVKVTVLINWSVNYYDWQLI